VIILWGEWDLKGALMYRRSPRFHKKACSPRGNAVLLGSTGEGGVSLPKPQRWGVRDMRAKVRRGC